MFSLKWVMGDAPKVLQVDKNNNLGFYPILNKEGFSWERLVGEAYKKINDGVKKNVISNND